MEYFNIYSREEYPNLRHVTNVRAMSAGAAMLEFTEEYGDNYGKVVAIPCLTTSKHHALEVASTK